MLVWDILGQAAAREPERPAVWFGGRWKSYGELWLEASRLAAFLVGIGVRPGDRIGILLENSFDYLMAHFGVLRAGAVEVSLNTELKGDGIQALLDDSGATVLIAGVKFLQEWKPVIGQLPQLRHLILDRSPGASVARDSSLRWVVLEQIRAQAQQGAVPRSRIDVDLASIIYTSGVTGKPKGVMLSHLNLVANTRSIVDYLKLTPEDRMMVVLPFHYIYGRSLLYSHFLSGGSLIIDNRFAFPAKVLDTMQEQEATCFAGVPSTFSILLKKTNLKARRFPRLRLVTQAGGGMAPALQQEVAEVFRPAQLYVMYGATEAAPRLTYVDPDQLPRKWGSIGKAIPNVEVFVADGSAKPLPPGVPGEIVARGSNVMMGYWKDPEATAQVLRHSCYFTGDLGYCDEEGFIFLTGRARDMIKTGGNRVSSKEIEDAILENPEVLEVAVIGVPDALLGEAIVAFVVPVSKELTAERLRKELGRRLPLFKLPKSLEFRERLPKNQAGKILKPALRAWAETATQAEVQTNE